MLGLTVRWSLTGAPTGALEALRVLVEDESFARSAGLEGLRFMSWRAVAGQWFEHSYVFVSTEARSRTQAMFDERHTDVDAVSAVVGSQPTLIEPCEMVAVVRGPAGFRSSSRFEPDPVGR